MIDLRGLNGTQVKSDGKTAVAGGGILQWELVGRLYEEGKYAGEFHLFQSLVSADGDSHGVV